MNSIVNRQNISEKCIHIKRESPIKFTTFIALVGGHIILALLMNKFSIISTFHAYLILGISIIVALSSKSSIKVAYSGAYIVSAEVLWRMTGAHILWETGKYAMSFIFIVAILKRGLKNAGLPLIYFGLLLPSIMLSYNSEFVESFTVYRKILSFNLSGPFSVFVAILFFSKIRIKEQELKSLFLIMLLPLIGIGTIASFHTFTTEEIYYIGESNFTTSGGYAPNQVSTALGFGAVLIFWYLMVAKSKWSIKIILYFMGFALATQCALTFSRGGLYCAVLGLLASSVYLIRSRKMMIRFIFTLIILILSGVFIAFPRLNEFTGGAIQQRFQETSMSGRESLIIEDFKLWQDNFILGVGPGLSPLHRKIITGTEKLVVAHTEFSRVVAEHGLLGFFSILILFLIAAFRFKQARTKLEKGFAVCMISWSLLYMITASMRIAMPSFCFGLAMIRIEPFVSSIVKKRNLIE